MSVQINGSDGVDSSGKLQSGGDPNDGTAVGAKMLQSGVVQAARASGASAVYMGYTQGTASPTSRINGDGSALFGTDYKVKIRPFNGANADQFQILDTSDAVTASITGGGSAVFNGVLTGNQRVVVNQAGTKTGTAETLLNYGGDGSTVTASINANGLIYTAAGINFGTVTSPVTSKTLEDYEEGSWTPTINKSGTTGSISSYTNRFGFYRRVGGLLFVAFYAYKAAGSFGTGTNQWYISGLPYNVSTLTNSAYQFISGGYMAINGKNYNFASSVGTGTASGVRYQANDVNGAATLSMYGVEHDTNWTSGAIEVSGSGVLMLA